MKLKTELSDFKTLDHGASPLSSTSPMRRTRTANQRIPKWAYLLFIILAAVVTYRLLQNGASGLRGTQPPTRPGAVAKAPTKEVAGYLGWIVKSAAYETVQGMARV